MLICISPGMGRGDKGDDHPVLTTRITFITIPIRSIHRESSPFRISLQIAWSRNHDLNIWIWYTPVYAEFESRLGFSNKPLPDRFIADLKDRDVFSILCFTRDEFWFYVLLGMIRGFMFCSRCCLILCLTRDDWWVPALLDICCFLCMLICFLLVSVVLCASGWI